MASGSQFMTTYYAKRIMGDNAASTADQALLQTGYGITTDTWILNRTNRPNYGILYHYDSNGADKIKFIGGINNTNDIETAWIQLDAGDTYILGRVGIGEDPTINNNPYKLYINGTTYTNAPVYINNSTAVAMEDDNGALVIGDKAGLNIGIDNCKVHARDNSAAADLLLNSEGGNILLGVDDNDYYVNIRSEQDASSTSTGALRIGGGAGIAKKLYIGDDIHSDGHLYFAAAKNIYMNYNGVDYPILENSDDSNIILNAATGILNIGHKNTIGINMYYSTDDSTRTQFFTINSNGAYANTRFGVNGQDTNYTLYVNGTSYFTNHMYIGRTDSAHIYLINKNWTKGTNPSSQTYSAIEYNDVNKSRVALLEATLDTSGNSRFNIYLVPNVADSTSWSGIILQKTTANVLTVNIAGTTTVSGTVHADGGYLKSTVNNNTVTIGSQNSGCCHIYNSVDIPFAFNRGFLMVNSGDIGSSSYPTGNIIVKSGGRISGNGGALYLGNSGNQNWVYVQDMCSQDGQKWKILQSGSADFGGTVTAPTFSGNATSATYLKDRTNSTATYANYGAAGLAASAISWLTCWNGYELRAISKAETMAAVRGAANGSWAISVTGSSASCTGNAATATKATQDSSGHTITSYYCTLSTAQTFTGAKTFNTTCYFANGTTYYVNNSGHSIFNTSKLATYLVVGSTTKTAHDSEIEVYYNNVLGAKITANTNSSFAFQIFNTKGTQTGRASRSSGAWGTVSSREVKHDIVSLPDVGAQVDALVPVSFKYKEGDQTTQLGLIYEDTVDILPEICEEAEGTKTINYSGLTPVLLRELQSLRKRVKYLEGLLLTT